LITPTLEFFEIAPSVEDVAVQEYRIFPTIQIMIPVEIGEFLLVRFEHVEKQPIIIVISQDIMDLGSGAIPTNLAEPIQGDQNGTVLGTVGRPAKIEDVATENQSSDIVGALENLLDRVVSDRPIGQEVKIGEEIGFLGHKESSLFCPRSIEKGEIEQGWSSMNETQRESIRMPAKSSHGPCFPRFPSGKPRLPDGPRFTTYGTFHNTSTFFSIIEKKSIFGKATIFPGSGNPPPLSSAAQGL
jgi:hypothetical protein